MIFATDAGFISPVDLGLLRFGSGFDGRVSLIKPLLNRLRLLLIGLSSRFLWSETPTAKILAHRADRHLQSKLPFNQLLHRLARPQGKGHLKLVGSLIGNHSAHHALLLGAQSSTLALPTAPLSKPQGFWPSISVKGPPFAQSADRNL